MNALSSIRGWIGLTTLIVATLAHSQPELDEVPLVTLVENKGVGTVYAPPSYVSFWLQFHHAEGDLKKSLSVSAPSEGELRAYLSEQELRPAGLEIYPLHVKSLEESIGTRMVQLQFSMAGFVGGESGASNFGALCEKIKALGVKFGCEVGEPELLLEDKALQIQYAVQEATKNAYKPAQGAAMGLGGVIGEVVKVTVGEVVWNKPPDSLVEYPTIEVVTCTVTVTVTYTVSF